MLPNIIIQARMSSNRLPGKVLMPIGGRPLMLWLFESMSVVSSRENIIIATSTEKSDDPIEAFCHENNINCFRGDLANVASRFVEIVQARGWDHFVRINGDSPLMDYRLVKEFFNVFNESGYDLVTNIVERTYPIGQSVEILKAKTFIESYKQFNHQDHFEHVTYYFYENVNNFSVYDMRLPEVKRSMSLAVDSELDAQRCSFIFQNINKPLLQCTWQELYEKAQHFEEARVL